VYAPTTRSCGEHARPSLGLNYEQYYTYTMDSVKVGHSSATTERHVGDHLGLVGTSRSRVHEIAEGTPRGTSCD
jgi:hypothetical protein